MNLKQYRFMFHRRIFRLCLALLALFSLICFVLYLRTLLHAADQLLCYRKPWSLLSRQTILVPVPISHLYDYRVVCSENEGMMDHIDLTKACQLDANQTVMKLSLAPPEDFQIRSKATSKYRDQWRTTRKCAILRNETIAIVIPYRDREENLRRLLFHLIPLLEKQGLPQYEIYLIEQGTNGPFNKGRLYNAAFNYLMRSSKPTCIIFHDVDLIPEHSLNWYTCASHSNHPIHMSAQVRFDTNGTYTHIYPFLVGGVLAIRPKIFRQLNGFSNRYFNWGGEDDDMGLRLLAKDICVQRPRTGFYYAASHSTQKRNEHRFELLFDAVLQQDLDGLTDIDQLARIVHVHRYPLVNWITVKWSESIFM